MAAPANLNTLNDTDCLRWAIGNLAVPPANLNTLDSPQCLRYMAANNLMASTTYVAPLNINSLDSDRMVRNMISEQFFGVATAPANINTLSEPACWRWVVATFTDFPANLNSFDTVDSLRFLIQAGFFVSGPPPDVSGQVYLHDGTTEVYLNDGTTPVYLP